MSDDAITVTLSMPIILTRDHSPNGRLHHQAKARATKRLREDARRAAMSHVNDPVWRQLGGWAALGWGDRGVPVTMDIEIVWPKGRKTLDDDNAKASLKPAIDGVADALWGGEDRHVEIGRVTQTRGAGGLTFTLRATQEQQA